MRTFTMTLAGLLLAGCSTGSTGSTAGSKSGGSTSTGGQAASGGAPGSGGKGGATNTGTTTTGSGGASGLGGTVRRGGATGSAGVSGRGGATGSAGVSGRGGATSSGGTTGGSVDGGGPTDAAPAVRSSGCDKSPPPLGFIRDGGPNWGIKPDYRYALDVAGTERTYVLRLPAGYQSNRPYPVVFLFHGTGGDGAMYDYTLVEQAAPPGSALFVLPDGLDYTWAQKPGWETFNDNTRDLQFFDKLWDAIRGSYCVDEARVFASGHSIGGFMSNYLGFERGNVVRAVAPLAGGGLYSFYVKRHQAQGQAAIMVVHGTADDSVEYASGVTVRDYFIAANHCSQTTTPTSHPPCLLYEGCDPGFPVQMCTYEGAGHTLNWKEVGPMVWNFFASF